MKVRAMRVRQREGDAGCRQRASVRGMVCGSVSDFFSFFFFSSQQSAHACAHPPPPKVLNNAHHQLSRLTEYPDRYLEILVKVTSALGNIYVHAGAVMTKARHSRLHDQQKDALALMALLRMPSVLSPERLQLCLNILIVLKNMVDYHMIPCPMPGTTQNPKRFFQVVQERLDLLRTIATNSASRRDVSFERFLDGIVKIANKIGTNTLPARGLPPLPNCLFLRRFRLAPLFLVFEFRLSASFFIRVSLLPLQQN